MTATITIPTPHVPYGPKHVPVPVADADYLRGAARNIAFSRCMGSNLTDTVVKLLNDAADAIISSAPRDLRAENPERYTAARDRAGGIRLNSGKGLLVAAPENSRSDVLDWFTRSAPGDYREQYRAALTLMNTEQGYDVLPTVHPDEQTGASNA